MQAIRLSMPSDAVPSRHSLHDASFGSEPTAPGRRFDHLGARDHRDDGSLIGGLIIMLSVALPFWVMVIILLTSLW
ncbi:MAG: hypothetical protein ACRD0H_15150 [Actinomycetes bacterium]